MKNLKINKIFIVLIIVFLPTNYAFSKILDAGVISLEVPNKYYLVNWKQTDFAKEICKEFSSCYGIVDKKIYEIIEEVNSGANFDEIKILKPLVSKYQKVMLSDRNFEKETKSLIKMFKSTLVKNKSGTIFNYYSTETNDGYEALKELDIDIDEIKKMSKLDLKKLSKKIKDQITLGKNYYTIMDGMNLNFNKFMIDKDFNNSPYLIFNGDITYYIIGSSNKIKMGSVAIYVSEIDNRLTSLDGYCAVKCSNFYSTFNSIIKKSFSQNTLSNNLSNSDDFDLIKKLRQLNNLYESGVLTKEEFEKAKKKIIN